MAAGFMRVLVFGAVAYLAVMMVLFVLQERFIFPAPQQVHLPAPGFESVTITTEDDMELTLHWREPQVGRPVIVWFHGNGGSLAGSTNETKALAAAGYGILLASYRGYGGNPGSPSEEGFYNDGRAAMAYLAQQHIGMDRTIIAANSIGSGTGVQMASEFKPAALMLVSAFSSLPDVAAQAMPIFPVRMLLRPRFENAQKLPKIECPILLLHGDADTVVPFAFGQKLASSNKEATFIAFKGAGHDLAYWQEAQEAQLNWLASQGL